MNKDGKIEKIQRMDITNGIIEVSSIPGGSKLGLSIVTSDNSEPLIVALDYNEAKLFQRIVRVSIRNLKVPIGDSSDE